MKKNLLSRLARELKHAIKRRSMRAVFSRIYRTNKWGDAESRSGGGSSLEATRVLRERLPRTIAIAIARQRQVYGEAVGKDDPVIRSFADFVELCERKEAETGEPCTISASW